MQEEPIVQITTIAASVGAPALPGRMCDGTWEEEGDGDAQQFGLKLSIVELGWASFQ